MNMKVFVIFSLDMLMKTNLSSKHEYKNKLKLF